MTQPKRPARTAVYSELMWPSWNPTRESYGVGPATAANALLDAYRAEVLAELTAELRTAQQRIAELERPAVEAERAKVRQSYMELAVQAREDRDFEGVAAIEDTLREREEQWVREDDAVRPALSEETV